MKFPIRQHTQHSRHVDQSHLGVLSILQLAALGVAALMYSPEFWYRDERERRAGQLDDGVGHCGSAMVLSLDRMCSPSDSKNARQ